MVLPLEDIKATDVPGVQAGSICKEIGSRPANGESENVPLGGAVILVAFVCFALMCALAKAASDIPTESIVFFQSIVGLIVLAPWVLRRGVLNVRTSRIPLHILRAISGLLSQALMFVTFAKMPLLSAVLLGSSAPLFIPFIAWGWLKEEISPIVWGSLIVGFVGVVMILDPNPTSFFSPYALLATGAGAFSALALVTINRLSSTEPPERILFYYFLLSSLISAPFAFATWVAPSPKDWICLLAIGTLMLVAQCFLILAYRFAHASRLAPFNYSVVIFSGILDWVIWHEVPGPLALLGAALVVAGGMISTLSHAARLSKRSSAFNLRCSNALLDADTARRGQTTTRD